MHCDIRYRFGNTLCFPRVAREPPCPRKASTRNDPGRREMHVLIEKKKPAVMSQFTSNTRFKSKDLRQVYCMKNSIYFASVLWQILRNNRVILCSAMILY